MKQIDSVYFLNEVAWTVGFILEHNMCRLYLYAFGEMKNILLNLLAVESFQDEYERCTKHKYGNKKRNETHEILFLLPSQSLTYHFC